ncbi:origin recognition complex subunit 2-domain-containing protein [Dendryphion nanum]|uniref:Origin recognition complex subunit 2 n=1 Tax=Dendryphion nanum TaxID=256645 RepID=A0A9P9DNY8_9PLEO|nr:origin recognition complex subunit 2-domain-containing protein [Dendryphion nanum]
MLSVKRKRTDDESENTTPRKIRAQLPTEQESDDPVSNVQTPSRKGIGLQVVENGTPRSILKKSGLFNGVNGTHDVTPKSNRKLVFETPPKSAKDDSPNGTPTLVRNADRSARRKSNRKLLQRAINGADSDEEALDEEETLAEQILSDEEDEVYPQGEVPQIVEVTEAAVEEETPVPETPSKRGRGRPKGSKKIVVVPTGPPRKRGRPRKQRSPTPPTDAALPPHEEYFWQNRPGGMKTSDNTLPSQSLLNHDEYFEVMQSYRDRHQAESDFLLELHSRAYDQWIFELEEGFNICLYGYGSKRPITEDFTAHLYEHLLLQPPYKGTRKTPKIAIVNGYISGTTIKEILAIIASAILPSHTKTPNQPASLLTFILDHLTQNPPAHSIPIILNSIDSPYLRRSPVPSMLAALAAHPSISLICTADTPNFALLWDVGLKAQYKFLFHDATTFAPYDTEIDVIESVNELLGRSGRRIGGRDGVGFVLRSLPENARSLFRILVTEQLALLFMDDGVGDADEDDILPTTPRGKKSAAAKHVTSESTQGVEYRVLYHKAVEEFVCSSEVGFRTLLKEFHDHQMIESRKDAMGTERLWVPFRQEELEGLAEELSGEMG